MVSASHNQRRGFTLVEMIVVLVIIILLMSILLVALAGARRAAGKAADRQNVVSLRMGVESFKTDFGFLPPMVRDVNTCKYYDLGHSQVYEGERDPIKKVGTDSDGNDLYAPVTFSFSTAFDNRVTRTFLRGGGIDPDSRAEADFRFSEYSLPYYLLGALGAEADGVEGPGFLTPQRDGSFSRRGSETAPYFDIGNDADAMVLNDDNGAPSCTPSPLASISRFELRDRNNVSYRYYRWLPGQPINEQRAVIEGVEDLNVPDLVGDPAQSTELRDAGYAIVAAGPNGVFGDFGTEGDVDGTFVGAEYVKDQLGFDPSDTAKDERAKEVAREDNIVEVGGK